MISLAEHGEVEAVIHRKLMQHSTWCSDITCHLDISAGRRDEPVGKDEQ